MLEKINHYFYIFLITSHLGWIMETVGCTLYYGKFSQRGSLYLPLCPIYGVAIILLFILIKTPNTSFWSKLNKKIPNKVLSFIVRYFLYFIIVFIICFAVEYLTGFIIDKLGMEKMWDYSSYSDNINGYVRWSFLLSFGIGGTLYMRIVVPFLYRQISYSYFDTIKVTNYLFFSLIVIDYWNQFLNGIK